MIEQQLVDYIKKAKEAGQSDEQSRAILYKSGWTETEVNDALAVVNPAKSPVEQLGGQATIAQAQVKPQAQPVVTAQPQSQPQSAKSPEVQLGGQAIMPQTRNSSGRLGVIIKLLVVLIIVVVLCGVGLFVGGQYINLPWNPFWPNSETVISKMVTNMKDVKSSHMVVQGEISAASNGTSQGILALNLNGDNDISDANNLKQILNLAIEIKSPGNEKVSVSVNMIVIGGIYYVKVSNILGPIDAAFSSFDISQIKDKWFKIDQDSIEALSQAQGGQVAMVDISQVNNPELSKKIQDLLLSENLLSVTKQFGDETISGQNTYHYLVTISKDKLKDLLNKMVVLQSSDSIESNPLVAGVMGVVADTIGDIDLEMWVGKKDHMLYQIKLDKTIDLSKIYPGLPNVGIKFNTTNSNFNKPVTVTAPIDAQKIEEVLLPLLKTQGIRSNLGQINYIGQQIFTNDNNYYALCYKGLINGYDITYGEYLLQDAKEIISQNAKNPSCFAGIQGYCVSTQLADGGYLCVDELGIVGTTQCVASTTICE